ncbi:MAG: hypothetical protein M3P06_11605 [Acidobacteriota bacterium]|nr:hypothetical protein [Acidobacteriota bacterium]
MDCIIEEWTFDELVEPDPETRAHFEQAIIRAQDAARREALAMDEERHPSYGPCDAFGALAMDNEAICSACAYDIIAKAVTATRGDL